MPFSSTGLLSLGLSRAVSSKGLLLLALGLPLYSDPLACLRSLGDGLPLSGGLLSSGVRLCFLPLDGNGETLCRLGLLLCRGLLDLLSVRSMLLSLLGGGDLD